MQQVGVARFGGLRDLGEACERAVDQAAEFGFAARLHGLVGQSMEMIEQRLRNIDIRQAGVQPDGPDRIRVLLPGIRDPEPVATLS